MKNTHGSTKKNVKNLSDRTLKNIFNQIYGRGIKAVSEAAITLIVLALPPVNEAMQAVKKLVCEA
jgi:hypothetical protein